MGLLYVAVLAMWVLVIVPAYLKRSDRRELERSMRLPLAEQLRSRAVRPQVDPRQRAFVRRRRVMMLLLTAVVGTGLGAATGAIPAYWVALPVLALAAFVAAAVRYSSAVPSARPAALQPTDRNTTVAQPLAAPHSWRPVETPMPGYLTANRAPRSPGSPEWTAADMLASAAARKAEVEQKLIAAQVSARQMRDITKERALRAAAAAEQARTRAVGE